MAQQYMYMNIKNETLVLIDRYGNGHHIPPKKKFVGDDHFMQYVPRDLVVVDMPGTKNPKNDPQINSINRKQDKEEDIVHTTRVAMTRLAMREDYGDKAIVNTDPQDTEKDMTNKSLDAINKDAQRLRVLKEHEHERSKMPSVVQTSAKHTRREIKKATENEDMITPEQQHPDRVRPRREHEPISQFDKGDLPRPWKSADGTWNCSLCDFKSKSAIAVFGHARKHANER